MKNWLVKLDNNDTAQGYVTAEDFNSAFNELEGVVSILMALNGADNTQLVRSIDMLAKAQLYADSGTQNTIVLSRGATASVVETLFNGMVINFVPAFANNGATTLNLNTLGAVPLKYNGADLTVNFLVAGAVYSAFYDLALNKFEIMNTGIALRSYFESIFVSKSGAVMTGAITGLRETAVAMPASEINLANGNLFSKTITAPTTFTLTGVLGAGNVNSFILELTNAGAFGITLFAGVKWAGGTLPTFTTSGVDIFGFYSRDGGTTWRGVVLSKDSK